GNFHVADVVETPTPQSLDSLKTGQGIYVSEANAGVFTMHWDYGVIHRGMKASHALITMTPELEAIRSRIEKISIDIMSAQNVVATVNQLGPYVEELNTNIKGSRRVTKEIAKFPKIKYVIKPFDKALKTIEGPVERMNDKLDRMIKKDADGTSKLDKMDELLTSVNQHLATMLTATSMLENQVEQVSLRRAESRNQGLTTNAQVNLCGEIINVFPEFALQELTNALADLNRAIAETGTIQEASACADDLCRAQVALNNTAYVVGQLVSQMDSVNATVQKTITYVEKLNAVTAEINKVAAKVDSGGIFTKTIKWIEDIPVIGWLVTAWRKVEETIVDPVFDAVVGELPSVLGDIPASPEADILHIAANFDRYKAELDEFKRQKHNLGSKQVIANKLNGIKGDARAASFEAARDEAFGVVVDELKTACELN
ncbi:MAG: hypothetical protein VX589_12660, partial [Myxococcota bacterium]|nr:hypothetical protein [Myxococcota bacterium]